MGLSISWIAARGVPRPALLDTLGLKDSGPSHRSRPVPVPARFVAFESGGWIFVAAPNASLASRGRVRSASRGGMAVGAYLDEHVMISGVFAAEDGELAWSAQHDPNIDPDHLDIWGQPPEALAETQAKLVAEGLTQPDVDAIFDVPILLAASQCHFDPNSFDIELDLTNLTTTNPELLRHYDPVLASALIDPSGASPEVRLRRPGLLARLFGHG